MARAFVGRAGRAPIGRFALTCRCVGVGQGVALRVERV